MKREEIEQAIENGESVYILFNRNQSFTSLIKEYLTKRHCIEAYYPIYNNNKTFALWFDNEFICDIDKVFKTKAEAEHYLKHANITRTETLPFLTWEEFLEKQEIEFMDNTGILTWLYIVKNKTKSLCLDNRFEKLKIWDLTEENFYKAYDECVRLFRGKEV